MDHANDPNSGGPAPNPEADSKALKALAETKKRVRLVRESSTFFRRMASAQMGVDLDSASNTPRRQDTSVASPGSAGLLSPALVGRADATKTPNSAITISTPHRVQNRGECLSPGAGAGAITGSPTSAGAEDEKICSICMCEARDAVLQPCGHGGFCYDCGKKLASKRSKCPLCRANISEVLRYDTKTSFRNNDGQEVVVATQSAKLSEGVNVV